MAASVLAGIGPSHGLYASFAGPVAGGLTSSTRLMVITTTSAAALAAGSAVAGMAPQDRGGGVVLVTLRGRPRDARRRDPQAGPLRAVRLPLGDERLPLRDRGQHPARPDPRPHRRRRPPGSTSLAKAWSVITHPAEIDGAVAGRRAPGDRRAASWPASLPPVASYGAVLALGHPDRRRDRCSASTSRASATPARSRPGSRFPHLPSLGLLSPGAGRRRRSSVAAIVLVQGVRRQPVGAQLRRAAELGQPRLRRPGRRQPGGGVCSRASRSAARSARPR